jgi:hypothetical protein
MIVGGCEQLGDEQGRGQRVHQDSPSTSQDFRAPIHRIAQTIPVFASPSHAELQTGAPARLRQPVEKRSMNTT